MADKTQTYGSTGGYDKVTAALQELNGKLQGISGTASTLSKGLSDIEDTLTNPQSQFFAGMVGALSSSMETALKKAESDRRVYENAKEQNAEAMRRSGAEPVRGQADFWSQAFSPVSKSPIEVQTEALKATFNDSGVQKLLKDSLSSATIRSAVNSDVDERTTGQKVLDTLTLGVSKDVRGILDRFSSGARAQKAEEKAIQKDQGTIKREKKQVDQLAAQYRALKSKNVDGQNDEKMQRILAELQERTRIIKDAEKRIDERKADPFADLIEVGQGNEKVTAPGGKPGQPSVGNAQGGAWLPQGLPLPLPVKIVETLESKVSGKPSETTARRSAIGDDRMRTQDVTGDMNEPVEMAYQKAGAGYEARDTKEAADIQRYLDTVLRPEFYKKGIKAFDKYNSSEQVEGKNNGGGAFPGKGGLYTTLGALTAAAAIKIGQAVGLTKEWIDSAMDANKRKAEIKQGLYDGHDSVTDEFNKGNRAALKDIQHAEDKLVGWRNLLSFDKRKEYGIHENDDGLGGFNYDEVYEKMKAEYEKGGMTYADKDAFLRMQEYMKELNDARDRQKNEFARYSELMKYLDRNKVDTGDKKKTEKAIASFDEEYKKKMDAKKKAAAERYSFDFTTPNAEQTPGANIDFSMVKTEEEKTRELENAMYNGTKRALMDQEVQQQNEENAKKQGDALHDTLVGRR